MEGSRVIVFRSAAARSHALLDSDIAHLEVHGAAEGMSLMIDQIRLDGEVGGRGIGKGKLGGDELALDC